MFTTPRIFKKRAYIACLALPIHLCSLASAQNFTMQIAHPDPLGLRNVIPGADELGLGMTDGMKGDYDYGVGVTSIFDTNFFIDESNEKSEFSTYVSPYLSYRSDPEGGARVSFTASYTPVMRAYLHNSDLNDVDQSGMATMKIVGGKTLITAYAKYAELSGSDRLSGGFVTGSLVNLGVQGAYQIAPRTTLSAQWTAAMSDYGTDEGVGSDLYTLQFGGFWAASERLSFGPSIRYMMTESDNIGSRDAWSLSMQAQYLVGERIRFVGSLGVEYAKNSGDGEKDTIGLTGDLTGSYSFNDRWAWSTFAQYATVPSPTEAGYVVNNLELTSQLERQLLRGVLGFGMEYNLSMYENVDTLSDDLDNENNLNVFISYRRNLISERVGFDAKIAYTVNDGETDWSQLQLSAGLSVTF